MPNLSRLAQACDCVRARIHGVSESIRGLLAHCAARYPAFQTPPESYANAPCPSLRRKGWADAGYQTAYSTPEDLCTGDGRLSSGTGASKPGAREVAFRGNVNSTFRVDEPAAVERILKWIDALSARQAFLRHVFSRLRGHHRCATPARGAFPGDTEFTNYLNALHYGDESLGALLRGLRDKLEDGTLFVVFGDQRRGIRGSRKEIWGIRCLSMTKTFTRDLPYGDARVNQDQIRARHTAGDGSTRCRQFWIYWGFPFLRTVRGTPLLGISRQKLSSLRTTPSGFLGLRDGCWKYILEVDSQRSKLYNVCVDREETKDRSAMESLRVDQNSCTISGITHCPGTCRGDPRNRREFPRSIAPPGQAQLSKLDRT